jgi:hypothetical protein
MMQQGRNTANTTITPGIHQNGFAEKPIAGEKTILTNQAHNEEISKGLSAAMQDNRSGGNNHQ